MFKHFDTTRLFLFLLQHKSLSCLRHSLSLLDRVRCLHHYDANGNKLVDSPYPLGVQAEKGSAVRRLKRYASWVQYS
jgi:hypothetical protein